jgi:hypothetical protein
VAQRELLEEALADRVELHHGGNVLGRWRRRSASKLEAGPARDVPDSKLADQLRLI